jgi:hypothetical protein
MNYPSLAWLLQPENSPHHIATRQVPLLTEQADYTFLSDLLRIPEDALYQMTLHRFFALGENLEFFPILKDRWKYNHYLQPTPPSYHQPINRPRLEKGLLRSFFLPNHITQICPLCLQEDVAYDRLYWKARFLLACHKHAVLLLRHCPSCQKRIPSNRLEPTSCPFCHHAYDSSSPIPISPDAACLLSGDLLTLHALGVTSTPPSSPASEPDPRTTLPASQYFALVRATCISLHPLQEPHFQTFLTPRFYDFLVKSKVTHCPHPDLVPPLQVAAAHWIFSAWPDHFFTFLHALEQWAWHARKKHAFYNFPDRFLLGSSAKEAYSFLSPAYHQYQATPAKPHLITPHAKSPHTSALASDDSSRSQQVGHMARQQS